MLALLNSDLSILVRSCAGTGKSLATALFMLSFPGQTSNANGGAGMGGNGPYITHLLIVPTPDLALQYYQIFEKLLKDTPLNIHKVVQHIYRCDEVREARQISLLRAHPGPRILIGTPTRILDILASPDLRDTLPLNNLATVAMDEVDQLLPRKDVFMNPKTQHHTAKDDHAALRVPAQILLNHVVPWRNTNVKAGNKDYFAPLRFIMTGSTASSYAKLVALRHGWITGRPMLRLGLDNTGGEFRKRLPRDVSNYFVTYDASLDSLKDTVLPVLDDAVVRDDKFLDAVRGINERRKKEILKESSILKPAAKQELLHKYVDGLCKLLKADAATSGGDQKRALVVLPDSFSISAFLEVLKSRGGVLGGTSRFSEHESGAVFTNSMGQSVPIDTQTLFLPADHPDAPPPPTTTAAGQELPQVLVYRAKGAAGLDFPGLARIYALSWDSILSSKLYTSLAGRCRAAPISERQDRRSSSSLTSTNEEEEEEDQWRPSQDPAQGRLVVLTLADEEAQGVRASGRASGSGGDELGFRLAASMAKIDARPKSYESLEGF